MSSQGTVSKQAKSFEQLLLECWGEWAKQVKSLGMVKPSTWRKEPQSFLFSDKDMCDADYAIARLPRAYKWAIERIFWHKNAGAAEYAIYPEAEDAFRQYLHGDGEDE